MKRAVILFATACGRYGFDDPIAPIDPHDEDRDGVPDQLDVCPALADDGADRDGDGVGDACDPNPDAPTERIALFEAFATDASLAWTRAGQARWTVADDDLVGIYTDVLASIISPPGDYGPPMTIATAYRYIGPNPVDDNTTASIVDALDIAALDSEKCGQVEPPGITIGLEMAGDTVDGKAIEYPEAFTVGGEYATTMVHDDAIDCSVTLAGSAPVSLRAPPYRDGGAIGLRIRNVEIAVHYLFVVSDRSGDRSRR